MPGSAGLWLHALPDPGFEFLGWVIPGWEAYGPVHSSALASITPSAKAVFKQITECTLTLKTKLEGKSGGGGDAKCGGYVTVSPAMKYYAKDRLVWLIPHPNPGYVCTWEGEGIAVDGKPVEGYQSMLLGLDTGEQGLAIRMTGSRSVTAVFKYEPIQVIQWDYGYGGGVRRISETPTDEDHDGIKAM